MQIPEKLKELLSSPSKIFITTHRKPDGDALGSCLGLYHYLIKKGHQPVVVSPTDYPNFLHWMPGNNAVLNYEEQKEKCLGELQSSDIIFCLDFNTLSRIDELGDAIKKSSLPKVLIDHHLEPEGFEDISLWDATAAATAQLIFEFIEANGDAAFIDKDLATCIYTGLVTDTGAFRFASVTQEVHRIAGELIKHDINHPLIHQIVFDNTTENRLRFFGYCMNEKLIVLPQFKTAYLSISQEEIQRYDIKTGDTEGLVNLAMGMEEVNLSVVIIDRVKEIKMSFRSKGSFPANELARKYFNGGGHLNAAGGSSQTTLEETTQQFTKCLKEYEKKLQF